MYYFIYGICTRIMMIFQTKVKYYQWKSYLNNINSIWMNVLGTPFSNEVIYFLFPILIIYMYSNKPYHCHWSLFRSRGENVTQSWCIRFCNWFGRYANKNENFSHLNRCFQTIGHLARVPYGRVWLKIMYSSRIFHWTSNIIIYINVY